MRKSLMLCSIVPILLNVEPLQAQDQGRRLRDAIFATNLVAVRTLASSPDAVNASSKNGVTPLMIASAMGSEAILKLLLAAGANVNARTPEEKVTALMFAANFGQLQAAKMLLDSGANVKLTDRDGYTAIDYAVTPPPKKRTAEQEEGSLAVAKLLKAKGAELKPDTSGAGANPGSALGILLAVISQPDLQKVLDQAKNETP